MGVHEETVFVSQSMLHRWKITTKWISDHIPPKSTVLDIGIGTGKYWEPIDSNYNIIGLNLQPTKFTKYEVRYIVDIEKDDLSKITSQRFKYICLFEVIEHLENPYFALRNINKILSDDGIFVGSTPDRMDLQFLIKTLFRRKTTLQKVDFPEPGGPISKINFLGGTSCSWLRDTTSIPFRKSGYWFI